MPTGTPRPLWNKFDDPFDCPKCLAVPAKCFYARDYVSRGGYKASEANNLVGNFKIEPRYSGTPRWRHKRSAANQFATELSSLLPDGISVAAISPCKTVDHEEYDPRFDFMFERLETLRPDISVCAPIIRSVSVEPAHKSKHRPSTDEILESLEYVGFDGDAPPRVALIDDLITTGKHFMACRQLLQETEPEIAVFGVFWARVIWSDPAGASETA